MIHDVSQQVPSDDGAAVAIGTVCVALPLDGLTLVRLALPVSGHPADVAVHANLAIETTQRPADLEVVGGRFDLDADRVHLGDWEVERAQVDPLGTQETMLIRLPSDASDPAKDPPETDRIVAHVLTQIDDVLQDDADHHVPIWGHSATLLSPDLRISVRVDDGTDVRRCEMFVADGIAIEWLDRPSQPGPLLAALPAHDVPLRLLQRCGLGRLACVGRPRWRAQQVDVRTTYTDPALVLGHLSWTESTRGAIGMGDASVSPMALVAEVLDLLPGQTYEAHHPAVGGAPSDATPS